MHGPTTNMNIQVELKDWLGYVYKMSCNPYQRVTGIEVSVRAAYIDTVVRQHKKIHVDLSSETD